MSKGNMHDGYNFGTEFEINFQKNIEKVLSDIGAEENRSSDELTGKDEAAEYTQADEKAVSESFEDSTSEEVSVKEDSSDICIPGEGTMKDGTSEGDSSGSSGSENPVNESSVITDEEAHAEETPASIENEKVPASDNTEGSDANEESAVALEQAASNETIDDTLNYISDSLAKQISEELENLEAAQNKKKKRARMMKIQVGIVAVLLLLLGAACFLGFTKPGNQLLLKMGLNIGGKIWNAWTQDFTDNTDIEDVDYLEEDDIASDAPEINPDTIVWPDHPGYGRHEEGVYNILLLGEEAIGSGNARGRTDLIIIATLNKNQKSIKLTSLMRDMLVQIPGYKDNKLNSAYEKGGIDLLYETIALNFNIRLDGCVLVNFENFEKIVDYLGGLEITLTKSEAKYLNSTNYISNPKYRNVVPGKQLMNGNQVLGYARIRKRAAITGNNNDYGRTDRHRIILNAIFDKYKTKSEMELVSIMFKVLPLVKTDIDSKTFEKLISTFIQMGTMEIEQLRIPADGTFTDNVKVRGMDVLIPDLDKNIKILHEFIFGS